MERDCWNCGVREENRISGKVGQVPCIFAEQMMRNPCRGWKSIDCAGDGIEEALERVKDATK